MEKGLLAVAISILIVLSPISYAYQLKTTETDPLEPIISALLEIQNKVTGLAITNPISNNVNTSDAVTKTIQEAQSRVQSSIQSTPSESYNYVYLGSSMIERINSSGSDVYFHSDHLGSTRLVTDSSGNRISENSYEPFGRDQLTSNNKIKFTGKEEDSSNLYYYGARYYDPEFGRFTQIDPMPSGESPYTYVENNPINKVDPSGKQAMMSAHGHENNNPLKRFVQWVKKENKQMEELMGADMWSLIPSGGPIGMATIESVSAKKVTVWLNKNNRIVEEGAEGAQSFEVSIETYNALKKSIWGKDDWSQYFGQTTSLQKIAGEEGTFEPITQSLGDFVRSSYSELTMKRVLEFIKTIPHRTMKGNKIPESNLEGGVAGTGITKGTRAHLEQLFDPNSKHNINNRRISEVTSAGKALKQLAYWIKKSGVNLEFFE